MHSPISIAQSNPEPGAFDALNEDLERLAALGRRRSLEPFAGLDFTSNDYLGLAASGELMNLARDALSRGAPVGAGGSRLLRGNHPEHEALESFAAVFFRAETALYFGSGYAANQTLFAAAPQRGDLVVYDERIHASVHDGIRLGRAQAVAARHNDVQSAADAIGAWRGAGGIGRAWIAIESLYSMDGDTAELADYAALADRSDAILVIDEAHATGVSGAQGRGLAAALEGRANIVTVHTCGKALGTAGALVCGPGALKEFLVNRGRAFIFATAPSPLVAAITRGALSLCQRSDARRDLLEQRVGCATEALARHCGLEASGSHIVPIVIGEDRLAVSLAAKLRSRGYDVRAIRPPTVPLGTARLRIALTLNVTPAAIEGLFGALGEELRGSRS
jgi:8-amino-7-oxononanoate synthase